MSVEKSSEGMKKVCGEAVTAFLWSLYDGLSLDACSQAPRHLAIRITTHGHHLLLQVGCVMAMKMLLAFGEADVTCIDS